MIKWVLMLCSGVAVISMAFWAYSQNYQTQLAIRHAGDLQTQIGELREQLGVLKAEWAYLNRPDNLRELADLNFDRLGLLPLTPGHFDRVDQVAFPADLGFPTLTPIDLAAILEGAE